MMNVWGTADLLFATYRGAAAGLQPGMLGPTFYIVVGYVPLLLTAHALAFRLLVAEVATRRRTALPSQESHAV